MTDVPSAPQPPEQPAAPPAAAPPTAPPAAAPNPYAPSSSAPDGQAGSAPYGGAAYAGAPQGKTNVLAITALAAGIAGLTILPLIGSIVAIITGHMSLGQIKRAGEKGRGMGLTGLILGYVGIVLGVLLVFLVIGFIGLVATTGEFSNDFS